MAKAKKAKKAKKAAKKTAKKAKKAAAEPKKAKKTAAQSRPAKKASPKKAQRAISTRTSSARAAAEKAAGAKKTAKRYTKRQLEAFHKILAERKTELLKQVTDQDDGIDELRDDVPADPLDMAGNTSTLELMTTLGNHERQELSEIDYALSKIADGSYGICEVSGELINEERLKIIPTARYTREVQEQRERRPGLVQDRPRRRALLTDELPAMDDDT